MRMKFGVATIVVLMVIFDSVVGDDALLRHRFIISGVERAGYLIKVVNRGEAGVLFVGLPSASHDWVVRTEKGQAVISCVGADRKERKYLAFRDRKPEANATVEDDDKHPLVYLTTKSDELSKWDIEDEEWDGNELRCFFKASAGECKGWYLCPGKTVDNLKTSNSPTIGFRAKAVTLSADKKPEWRYYIDSDGK